MAAIVMLDFETTGLSPAAGDRITEVAALRIVDGRVVARFVSLVNCQVRIPAFITGLTGITQAMVDGAPPVAAVVPRLLEFIGTDALAAHNASFDEKFLQAEAARLDLTANHCELICTLKLARRLFPGLPSYQLGQLSRQFRIAYPGHAHRAEADADVAAHVLLHMANAHGLAPLEPSLLAAVNRLAAVKVAPFLAQRLIACRT